jgi:cardiolipin synthase
MNNKIITIPNLLTFFRLALIPVFVILFLFGFEMVAFAVFLLAGLTDVIDGYIARKYQLISKLGKILDPLADKALRMSAVVVFVITGVLPVWVLVAMLSFDLFLISNVYGKLAGFFSMFALILCFFHAQLAPAHLWFVSLSLVLIFVSIISYTIKVKKDCNTGNIK